MKRIFPVVLLCLLPLLFAGSAQADDSEVGDFKVVVHPDSPEASISLSDLSRHFLKKSTQRSGGSKITPLDHPKNSELREIFLSEVHGMDEKAYVRYWLKLIFAGRAQAPEILASDAEVLARVAIDPTAIGYVSSETEVPSRVKVLVLVR